MKFKESRRRALQREFAPRDLPDKEIFTENKAEKILERRRKKALERDMTRSQMSQRHKNNQPHSESGSKRNRDHGH